MWYDLDNILELTVGALGSIVVIVFTLSYLEDHLTADPDRPRGLSALRAWWQRTK